MGCLLCSVDAVASATAFGRVGFRFWCLYMTNWMVRPPGGRIQSPVPLIRPHILDIIEAIKIPPLMQLRNFITPPRQQDLGIFVLLIDVISRTSLPSDKCRQSRWILTP
ncbi:hypothetical protein Zmor_009169 [Zophobas morio]|uniref:Uncharacterized protein n=1 Tax=Zophobas morio TaxID=2755281 RepID=A0AA38IQB5_9CUCU|nr:hypothetical protein Zmor_009169 [Zophobas morio]